MRLLLVGGGHSHLEALLHFAARRPRSLDVTLVTPRARALYSGMVPGVIAGHFDAREAMIDLASLAATAGATLIAGSATTVDLDARVVTIADAAPRGFDVLSLNVGGVPRLPGATSAVGVKPLDRLLAAWRAMLGEAQQGRALRIAVVGGGAAGIEVAFAIHHGLARFAERAAASVVLATDGPALLPDHPPSVARRVERLLARRGLDLVTRCRVASIEPGAIVCDDGQRIEADHVVLATGAIAPLWLARSGLECDDEGSVRVDATLRSRSHPFVFATGDCASGPWDAAKAGVHAVRQGRVLAANLLRTASGDPLARFAPRARSLALVSTGAKYAVATWGRASAEGRWAWRLKAAIDRAHMARYPRPPVATPLGSPAD